MRRLPNPEKPNLLGNFWVATTLAGARAANPGSPWEAWSRFQRSFNRASTRSRRSLDVRREGASPDKEDAVIPGIVGGVLAGLGAALLWVGNGRIAGIGGILRGALVGDGAWRGLFLGGLVTAGFLGSLSSPADLTIDIPLSWVAIAGVLAGVGVTIGNGCTSGHGICGLARFSPRSFVAVGLFCSVGAAASFLVRG